MSYYRTTKADVSASRFAYQAPQPEPVSIPDLIGDLLRDVVKGVVEAIADLDNDPTFIALKQEFRQRYRGAALDGVRAALIQQGPEFQAVVSGAMVAVATKLVDFADELAPTVDTPDT